MGNSFILSSDCQIVSGYLRSAIYDLTRQKYYLFKSFSSVNELDEDVISFLKDEELLLQIPIELIDSFPPIDFSFKTNQVISSCQLRYFEEFDITKITSLNCRDLSFIINDFVLQKEGVGRLLQKLNSEPINSVQLHIIDTSLLESDFMELRNWVINYSFCISYVYNNYFDYQSKTKDLSLNIFFLSLNSKKESNHFYINITAFSEAQKHNLFYNQFLLIDECGNIKNSPYSQIEFGSITNIESEQLKEIVQSDSFNFLWIVKKNIIDVCMDCEFRYMCCDDKLPIKRRANEWYYEQECNYNPYIAKWSHEEGYLSLVECGVISNEHKYSIDHERIAKINQKLWEE